MGLEPCGVDRRTRGRGEPRASPASFWMVLLAGEWGAH